MILCIMSKIKSEDLPKKLSIFILFVLVASLSDGKTKTPIISCELF